VLLGATFRFHPQPNKESQKDTLVGGAEGEDAAVDIIELDKAGELQTGTVHDIAPVTEATFPDRTGRQTNT
jgi:hypothetical protein